MALASTPTLLSIDEWAANMGISPWSFNQLDMSYLGVERNCSVWFQHEWQQAQTLTRETVARAIADAESMLAQELTYWPAPRYSVGEQISYPRPYQAARWNLWSNNRSRPKDVKTRWGYVISPGVEARASIDDDVTVTFSDADGDGFDDWWTTGPVSTTVTRAEEIGAYIRDADRPVSMEANPEETFRLRPVRVELDTTAWTVTVSGPIWLLVDPVLQIAPAPQPLDPTDAAIYLGGIKITRRYVDQSNQGVVVFEQQPCGSPCSTLEVCACFGERDAKMGYVTPQLTSCGDVDEGCVSGAYAPDFVRIHYKHGHPLGRGYCMDTLHAQMVALLAATLLPDKSCVECSETQIDHWRGTDEDLPFAEAENPFGMQRGAVWAWRRVREMNSRKVGGAIL